MGSKFLRSVLSAVLILGTVLGVGAPVHAATKSVFAASVISLNVPRQFKLGEVAQVQVTLKNLGNTTWKRDGGDFVSLYHWNPSTKKEIVSVFAQPTWDSSMRPARLPVPSVAPGGQVTFSFSVRAPAAAGVYREAYILASENVAWIPRSNFDLEVVVGNGFQGAITPATSVTLPPVQPSVATTPATTETSPWQAKLLDKGGIEWQLEAGDRTSAELTFLNVGTATWLRDTGNFVSLYAVDSTGKKGRASSFVPGSSASTPVARMKEAQVLPGQMAHVKLVLRGAEKPGSYQEAFALAVENTTWVDGGLVVLPIAVPQRDQFIGTAPPEEAPSFAISPTTPSAGGNNKLFAGVYDMSLTPVTGAGYVKKDFYVQFRNVSVSAWQNPSIRFIDLRRPSTSYNVSLQDGSWMSANNVVELLGTTKPNDLTSLAFAFRLPANKGAYTAIFQLYVNNQPVQGGVFEVPLVVTSDASIARPILPTPTTSVVKPAQPSSPTSSFPPIEAIPLSGDVSSLPTEPLIRVGVLKTVDDRAVIQAMNVPVLIQQSGSTLCQIVPGQQVAVHFNRSSRLYVLENGPCPGQSSNYYTFRAQDGVSPMKLADYDRNDNTFRTQLELRFTPLTDSVWVINELLIEWYLKGIAETSNVSPAEFQRTLLTTARTYAMYHVQRGGTKHADEFYTVDARYDQVYRGYGAESRTPTISAAVDATRGQIVTYQGRLAITPYFSSSDGRTRGWGEVWGGASSYPWLISVPVPEDIGRQLLGHGVGMSAVGALSMANNGKRYNEILSYFYQGTELRRVYR